MQRKEVYASAVGRKPEEGSQPQSRHGFDVLLSSTNAARELLVRDRVLTETKRLSMIADGRLWFRTHEMRSRAICPFTM